MKPVYLDYAATTPPDPRVTSCVTEALAGLYGNTSSQYSFGRDARAAVEKARRQTASLLGASPEEIFFTSGGSESDNWALKGMAFSLRAAGRPCGIVTTAVEHHAVLRTCEWLSRQGFSVRYLPVDREGKVPLSALAQTVDETTGIVSVMLANNEVGTIEPIAEIGKIAHEHGVLFHTDAVQAYTQVPIDVEAMNIDMMSTSGHKINGPKGIGFLYIRKGVKIKSFIHGGAQERHRRAGTENVTGIIGLAKAAEIATANMKERTAEEIKVRDHLIERIEKEIPYAKLNGDRVKRLPNNVNFSFQFVEGESMLILLDSKGICASSGSACTSGSLDPSHVLLAIGLPHEIAHGSLRLTISDQITMEDADYVVDNLKEIVNHLREMSPLYEDFIKKNK